MLIFVQTNAYLCSRTKEKSHVVDWETHRTKLKTEATLSSNGGLPRPSDLLAYGEQSRLQRGRGSQILFFGVFT